MNCSSVRLSVGPPGSELLIDQQTDFRMTIVQQIFAVHPTEKAGAIRDVFLKLAGSAEQHRWMFGHRK
jgi:hypothetical protein